MKHFIFSLMFLSLGACQKNSAPQEVTPDEYVLIEFAGKLEEEEAQFKKLSSP